MTLCLSYPKYIMVGHTCCFATAYLDVQMHFLSFCVWYMTFILTTSLGWVMLSLLNLLQNKDDEYVRNQQQNISDAIALLPRLATGIDVNVRFTQ